MTTIPLQVPRLLTLALTAAFGAIGGSVGINSIVKRNQAVARIKHEVAPIQLIVDTFDLLRPGVVLAVGCAVLGLIAVTWLGLLLLDILKSRKSSTDTRPGLPISTRTLNIQWISLAFGTLWVLACNIPVTYIAATRSAKTIAFVGGIRLPQAAVDARQAQLGVNPAYWSNDYVRLQVIPPWVTFLFGLLATIVALVANKKRASLSVERAGGERISSEADRASAEKAADKHEETV